MTTQASELKSDDDSQLCYANGVLVESKTKVMITGLPPAMTSDHLRECFANYDDSQVVECRCISGVGFIMFSNEESAQNTINSGISIGTTPLQMRFAIDMTNDSPPNSFILPNASKFAQSSIVTTRLNMGNDNDSDFKEEEKFSEIGMITHVATDGVKHFGFGCGKTTEKADISFSHNNNNGIFSINTSDSSEAVFGNTTSTRQRKRNLRKLMSNVISRDEALSMIDRYIGPKERRILILGELDFTFALSIIRKFGDGHNVISTSYNSKRDDQKYKHSLQNRITININDICKFQSCGGKSIVFRGFDGLKVRESLIKHMGNDAGSRVTFDKILFSMPFSSGSNPLDIRNVIFLKSLFKSVNSVVNRQGDVKPELHLLMPIFSTRSQFESHKIEEIGQQCQLKWRLKTVKIFDHPTLDVAFPGYNQRENCGIRLNKHTRNGIQDNETFNRPYQYVGYYILETM